MGAYLSQPVTDKETVSGEGKTVEYGVSSMQGWRRTMEDAHVAMTELHGDTEVGIFGVFDGHGGAEVAKFCQEHIAAELLQLEQYKEGQIGESLIRVFHRMDEMLRDEMFSGELEGYRGAPARTPEPPTAGSAAPSDSGLSSSAHADDPESEGPTAEQQQTLDVMKRILEIKRMVTEGTAGGGAAGQQQQQQQPAGGGAGRGALGRLASGAVGIPVPGADDAKLAGGPEEANSEQCGQVGCTAVLAVMKGRELFVANAGDSRAVLGRAGQAVALSEDHKPASTSEKQRITDAGGFVSEVGGVTRVNGNLNLSRAIGDLRYKGNGDIPPEKQIITAQPDVRRVSLTPADRFLLLACDGIWDVMSNQQAVEFVNTRLDRNMKPGDICIELLDACLAKNPKEARGIGCDNMTANIIVFKK